MKIKKIKAFMNMAYAIAELSPDEQTKVGGVLISSTGRQIASGYNGFLRGAPDDTLPKTRPEKYEYMQHAERNILYNCLDEGIRTRDCTLICTLSPCLECVRACFQAGISQIIFDTLYFPDTKMYEDMKDVVVSVNKKDRFTVLDLYPSDFVEG